ncbi:hypothetical protein BCV72DRAFT_236924 [Rhizopus microsporus var. microsporus]|uniref:Uncharacterized protein n=2 Tax=Rhizopus microsporus TaxID=58291 RepID=A0A2G4SMC4_RHIZD|nr:uncharacterized protein RHIMIDRAFT_261242 [Rhizopus microsporus ATCC 52813]ORE01108.1 hypothetical protein BCV72DRAFT_236924 [Rhizopus microsporus var. microsporus]PHZ09913.1 hypothetical protein RHIMIDRAFT_261242 [Rhizopus microsporus ATCC 52813]
MRVFRFLSSACSIVLLVGFLVYVVFAFIATQSQFDQLGNSSVAFGSDDWEDDVVPEGSQEKHTGDTWKDWRRFLEEFVNKLHSPALSPERYGVVWYGPSLRRRPSLSEDMYTRMRCVIPTTIQLPISSSFKDTIKSIVQSDNRLTILEMFEIL